MKNSYKLLLVSLLLVSQFTFSQNDEDVQKHPLLTDKFVFSGGFFFPNKSFDIAVNGDLNLPDGVEPPVTLPEEGIDFDENFDINQFQFTYALGFQWRFAKKWKLYADFFGVNNIWEATLDEPIKWEEIEYQVGADVKAGVGLGVLRTAVARVLSQGPKHELGVSLGAHIMTLNVFIEGQATIVGDDDEVGTEFQKGSLGVTAPLPNIGAYYHWAANPRWIFTADVDWLYIAFGEYQGGLWDVKGGVQFQVVDFFGVGASYRYYGLNLDVDKPNWNGSLTMSYGGPMVMVNFNF